MAVVNVSTPAEFLTAINDWNAEVYIDDGAVLDFSDAGVKSITLNCISIHGNGATIRNLTVKSIYPKQWTTAYGYEPVTTIQDLKIENLYVTPKSISGNRIGDIIAIRDISNFSPTINFNNCIISVYANEYTKYFTMANYSDTHARYQQHINFYGCSIHLTVERNDFRMNRNGSYAAETCESLVTFELCKMHISMPLVTNGTFATDAYYHKCDIYYYMPQWEGTVSGGSYTNCFAGQWYESCVIRGNLTKMHGITCDSDWPETETITVVCATVASDCSLSTAGGQIRLGTEDDARNPDWLLAMSLTPTHPHFDLVTENPTETDWQIDPHVNYGFPFIQIMPELVRIYPVERPKTKLRIFDMASTQSALSKNGLAILDCIEATVHEVINGEYSLTFSHPIDSLGKWKYIKESNIVRCLGQYFTIVNCVWDFKSEKSGTVTASCEHIFYQQNDWWIFPENVPTTPYSTCKAAMDGIMGAAENFDDQTMHRFVYEWDSDWSWDSAFMVNGMDEGFTPISGFLGSNGITAIMGGELYRDNFYFSINERMENASDNAFDIRFGNNAAGIKRTVDTSGICTFFKMFDSKTGSWFAISYSNSGYPLFQFPHTVPRSQTVTLSQAAYDEIEAGNVDIFDIIGPMGCQIFYATCTPVLCYEVDMCDVDLTGANGISLTQDYKVGDSGRVHDKLLNVDVIIKITETEKNGLTGKTTKVVFGSKNSFTRASGYPKPFEGTAIPTIEAALWLHDNSRAPLRDKNGKKIMRKVVSD